MQKEIRSLDAGLFYELTTQVYNEEILHDIYLNFIEYSNLDYYTSVQKKKSVLIPLIFYNYSSKTFEAKLGESSLTQTYREFLTEAFMAEGNRSTCFNLIEAEPEELLSGVYSLNIRVKRNETTARMSMQRRSVLLWFGGDSDDSLLEDFDNNKVKRTTTSLCLEASLTYDGEEIFTKEYTINREHEKNRKNITDSYTTNDVCLQMMTESLSYATKQIVEEITRELHLLLLSK